MTHLRVYSAFVAGRGVGGEGSRAAALGRRAVHGGGAGLGRETSAEGLTAEGYAKRENLTSAGFRLTSGSCLFPQGNDPRSEPSGRWSLRSSSGGALLREPPSLWQSEPQRLPRGRHQQESSGKSESSKRSSKSSLRSGEFDRLRLWEWVRFLEDVVSADRLRLGLTTEGLTTEGLTADGRWDCEVPGKASEGVIEHVHSKRTMVA